MPLSIGAIVEELPIPSYRIFRKSCYEKKGDIMIVGLHETEHINWHILSIDIIIHSADQLGHIS